MTFSEHDAKVGSLLKEKDKAEKRLKNRLCRAKQSVNVLRILADCFDGDIGCAEVLNVIGDKLVCDHPSISKHPNRVKGNDAWPEFPPDLRETVSEICELKMEISRLSELLETELNCS